MTTILFIINGNVIKILMLMIWQDLELTLKNFLGPMREAGDSLPAALRGKVFILMCMCNVECLFIYFFNFSLFFFYIGYMYMFYVHCIVQSLPHIFIFSPGICDICEFRGHLWLPQEHLLEGSFPILHCEDFVQQTYFSGAGKVWNNAWRCRSLFRHLGTCHLIIWI